VQKAKKIKNKSFTITPKEGDSLSSKKEIKLIISLEILIKADE
jgi:hypothetical protein